MEKYEGYCVKCKTQRPVENARRQDMERRNKKTGAVSKTPAVKGECGTCGTGMFKILSKAEKQALGI